MGPVTEMVRVGSVELCAQPFGERGDPAGISMGGAMAQLVALDHPDRVSSLVLVSTTAPGGPSVPMDERLRAYQAVLRVSDG